MKLPRQLLMIAGCAPVLAAVMVGSMVFNEGRIDTKSVAAQAYPTPDPCDDVRSNTGAELTIAGERCVTPTEETLPKTHTPEPKPTDEPKTAVPNTPVPPTVAATNTPTGGAGAGGLKPPSTGTGGDSGNGAMSWMLVAGGLVAAVAGAGSIGYGARRK